MDKLIGIVFLILAGLIIYDGGVFIIPGIPMQVDGWDRYFYAMPNILIGTYLLLKRKDIEEDVYTCEKCSSAFWEKDLNNGQCTTCGEEVKNIKPKVTKNLQI